MIKIVVFGDLVRNYPGTMGDIIDRISYTWPHILERRLNDSEYSVCIRNSGLFGETTSKALNRIDADVLNYKPDYVIILFGIDDSLLINGEEPVVPLDIFRNNIRKIIRRIKEEGAKPILVTPNPLTRALAAGGIDYNIKRTYQVFGINHVLSRYVEAIKNIAKLEHVALIDLFKEFQNKPEIEELLSYGCVPNRVGSRFIADRLYRYFSSHLNRKKYGRRYEENKPITIVAFGDSVTAGTGDSLSVRWRRILERNLCESGFNVMVRNSGISSERTVQANDRIGEDALSLNPEYVLICYGLNDAWIKPDEKPVLDPSVYGKMLKEMVRNCKAKKAVPILVSPNPFTDPYMRNFQRKIYKEKGVNGQLSVLVKIMGKVAREEKVDFINIFKLFLNQPNCDELVKDGSHPSPEGNQFWAKILTEYFLERLRN